MFSVEQCATLACLVEVTVPKPGNVHRGADFEDTTFLDFAVSAVAIGPAMAAARENRLGVTVLNAIRATRRVTSSNTNLGIVLLLSPLAAVRKPERRSEELGEILSRLGQDDAADIYEAIGLANPGGMGQVRDMDVAEQAPTDLLAAMRAASDRDLIAQQYVSRFELVLGDVAPRLADSIRTWGTTIGVIEAYVWLLANYPDSLINRKCGPQAASEASAMAAVVMESGPPESEQYANSLAELDFWLRQDGNRRNPGTSADLIAAGLFVCLQDETIEAL